MIYQLKQEERNIRSPIVEILNSCNNLVLLVTGDTETGKTLSIEGIIDRAINMIYSTMSQNKNIEYKVRMRYIQIAFNKVTDLLAKIDDNADHDDMNYIYKIIPKF